MASTILVADDDRAIRMVLNQALIRLGHDVRMTGNAATLWRWVAEGEGDLVIIPARDRDALRAQARISSPCDDAEISARRLADLGDRDVYGAQQHAPLLDLEL